jgi:hypothetical protein
MSIPSVRESSLRQEADLRRDAACQPMQGTERVTSEIALTQLNLQGRCLLNERSSLNALGKLPTQDVLVNEIKELIDEAMKDKAVQKLVEKYRGKFSFELNENDGFVLIFGNEKIKLKDFSEFFIKEDPTLNIDPKEVLKRKLQSARDGVIGIFTTATKTTKMQRLFCNIKEATEYAEKANLGQRQVAPKKSDETDLKIQEIFKKANDQIKTEKEQNEKSYWKSGFVNHKGKYNNASNLCGLTVCILSLAAHPWELIVGIIDLFRALGFAVYKLVEIFKGKTPENKGEVYKYTFFERIFHKYGIFYAFGVFILGLFLILEGALHESLKAAVIYINYIFSAVLAPLFGLWNMINFGSQARRIGKLRDELNGFLENPNLDEKEKYRAYLSHLKTKAMLSAQETNKIKEKVISEEKEAFKIKLKKESPEITDEEIERRFQALSLEEKINLALHQENRFKIEKLITCTSGGIYDDVLNTFDAVIKGLDSSDEKEVKKAIDLARELVKKIDKVTHQNATTFKVYAAVGFACLAASVVFSILGSGGAALIFWLVIASIYVLWDCETINLILTGFWYRLTREEKAYQILNVEPRSFKKWARTEVKEATGWKWLKSEEAAGEPRRVSEVAAGALSAVAA